MTDSQLDTSLKRIDREIQYFAQVLCNHMNLPYSAIIPNWVLAIDERLFDPNGKFIGDGVYTVSKPEQPKFITEKLLEKGYEQHVQQQYMAHGDDPNDNDDDVEAEVE